MSVSRKKKAPTKAPEAPARGVTLHFELLSDGTAKYTILSMPKSAIDAAAQRTIEPELPLLVAAMIREELGRFIEEG